MSKPVRFIIGVYLFAYALLLLLIASDCSGQSLRIVPDCCDQAVRLQLETNQLRVKLDTMTARRDTTKAIAKRLIAAKDTRISELEKTANTRITELLTRVHMGDLKLDLVKSELQNEMLRGRFLGWGRRRWANALLIKLKSN